MPAKQQLLPAVAARIDSWLERLEDRRLYSHAPPVVSAYAVTDLVANMAGKAKVTDANLINPWGIAFNTSFNVIWTANNGSGNSTVYNPDGTITNTGGLYNSITIPPPAGSTAVSAPTGEIFNTTSNFVVTQNGTSGAAAYIWSTEDGTISAWNPSVDPTSAILEVDRSSAGAVFKGLATASHKTREYLYATDFRNGKVDVFNSNFAPVTFSSTAFVDAKLPKHFAPFGIQDIGNDLYVTYAKQDGAKHDDVAGAANGIVDVFSNSGVLLKRFAAGGTLNSPWGVVQAPASFGKLSGDVLVGNFGDGKLSAFNAKTDAFVGLVGGTNGTAVVEDGLWGLTFGPASSDKDTLFFTSGPSDEADGLLGTLTVSSVSQSSSSGGTGYKP